MSAEIERIVRRLEEDEAGTIVSIICTSGWHGSICDGAREQSASRMPCACECHEAKS